MGERGPIDEATLGDRYRIESLIARGGMADVYRAHDEVLDRPVAVKVFRPGTAEPERFRNETLLLAQLEHPHLVSLYDGGDHDGAPFLVMELCLDATMFDRMANGPLSSYDVAALGTGVADALAAVHDRGIVHRDVKPSNILFAVNGRAVLADFGVARIIDSTRLTAATDTVGTGAYFAPEQVTGGDVGPPADVYALGLVLLEALTGERAFGTGQEAILARLARRPEVPEDLGPDWGSLLADMTDPEPAARPTAPVVVGGTGDVGDDEPTSVIAGAGDPLTGASTAAMSVEARGEPTSVFPAAATPGRRPGRRGLIWVAVAALALIVIGAAVSANDDELPTPPTTTASADATTTTTAAAAVPPPTTAAPPTTSACAGLEQQKQNIEQQKEDASKGEAKQLDAAKKAIDEQLRAAHC